MRSVEDVGASITSACGHLDVIIALILILLEERQAADLQGLSLILDLAVDDLQLEDFILCRILLLDLVEIGQLLTGSIHLVIVGVRREELVLGSLFDFDPGFHVRNS